MGNPASAILDKRWTSKSALQKLTSASAANSRNRRFHSRPRALGRQLARGGSIYIAVLGTSLIVSLLALSALALQRLQNKSLLATADIRQAQLNAESAVELGLLAMKQDPNWRTTYTSGHWIVNRALTAGTCSLDGTDPVDGNLANNTTDSVVFTGIGDSGTAEQRVQVAIDPRSQPLSCLRSGLAVGHALTLTNTVLRSSAPITVSSVSSTNSTVYGNVQGVTVSGSTYTGTTAQVSTNQLPTMPTWSSLFDYYKTNGTQLDYTKIPTQTGNFARNTGVESAIGTNDWTGSPIGASVATVAQTNTLANSGSYSLKVSSRADNTSGAAQYIDSYALPGQTYAVDCYIRISSGVVQNFTVSICTKGTGAAQTNVSANLPVTLGLFGHVSTTVMAPSWSGPLSYAYVKIAGAAGNTSTFYIDDFSIREYYTGHVIYQQTISPSVNNLYSNAPTNSQGIYWVDCGLSNLTIARSRIKGTILVINPGVSSSVGPGPVRWSPAVAGYPALLVHADTASKANFSIQTTNRVLSETENGVNYNPTGAPGDDSVQDSDVSDIYSSELLGLVAIENNLTYTSNSLIRGGLVVGNDLTATGGSLEIAFQPESLLNPPPGFTSANTYVRRAASMKKAILP
jgi:Carbohydrate binding domain